jgi:non-canonical (house-cleaning) NTP pyrophosphatase
MDRIISIENGIYKDGENWIDKAAIVIYNPKKDKEYILYSEGIKFPKKYVEKAKHIGFEKITVGEIMFKDGFVKK